MSFAYRVAVPSRALCAKLLVEISEVPGITTM